MTFKGLIKTGLQLGVVMILITTFADSYALTISKAEIFGYALVIFPFVAFGLKLNTWSNRIRKGRR